MASSGFYPKEYSRGFRAYLFLASLTGTALLAYCAGHAVFHLGYVWLFAVAANAGSAFFTVWVPLPATESERKGDGRGAAVAVTVGDFFAIGSMLVFSPEAGAVVGAAASWIRPPLAEGPRWFYRGFRAWYNVACTGLMFYSSGKLFYWLLGEPPPVLQSTRSWLHLIGSLDIALIVALAINVAWLTVALKFSGGQTLARMAKSQWPNEIGGFVSGNVALVSAILFQDMYFFWMVPAMIAMLVTRWLGKRVVSVNEARIFLQLSLDALLTAIAVVDPAGRIVATNRRWEEEDETAGRMFGGGLRSGADYMLFCEASAERVSQAADIASGLGEVLASRRDTFSIDYCCEPAAAEACYTLRVSRFESPRGPRFVVAHEDVSYRKRSERLLRDSERRYRRFFEEDLTGDFVAEANGVISDCNPALARMLDFASPQEAVGADFFSLFADPEKGAAVAGSLRRRRKLYYAEIELKTVKGRLLNAVANLTAGLDDNGDPATIRGYLFDDTRRMRLESALLQAQKMEAVGRLAGGIAHRFNNILTVVTCCAEFLREELEDHRQLAVETSCILKSAAQGGRLASQFLVFSQPHEPVFGTTDLDATVEGMLPLLRRLLGDGIRFVCSLNAPVTVPADTGRIEQVVLNLVVNARDAMPDGGELLLETSTGPGDGAPVAWLSVRDSGQGIAEEVKLRLFEPFFTTKREKRGTGLGLATVYGIVRQCGGRIEVESSPGRGSTFRVSLPAIPAADRRVVGRERLIPDPAGGETVLLVEDEREVRRLAARVLTNAGYRVLEASDGAEAIQVATRAGEPIDLLLTDVVMPRVSGWELAERIGELVRGEVKVLLMSGHMGEEPPEDAHARDWTWLAKPFGPDALLRKVREALAPAGFEDARSPS